MKRLIFALAAVLAAPAAARAQDFGVEWLDRVTHEREPVPWPLSVRPVQTSFEAGALYEYDTNIFLEPADRKAANIVIPFARGRLDYAAPRWDAAADILIDYKRYLQDSEESDLDERAYGRLRYINSRNTLQIAEIFRHESDPSDGQFAERAERVVSSTTGHAAVQVSPDFSLEANALLSLVFFRDHSLDDSDNRSLRGDLTAVWRADSSLDLLAQAGWFLIDYRENDVPDSRGVFARAGLRGEPIAALSVTALAGITGVRSEPLEATGERRELRTADASVNLRYEAAQDIVLWGDYTRQAGFAGPGDPFEIIDRWVAIMEWQATPLVDVRGRLQYDRIHSALGLHRSYLSLGPSATLSFTSQLHLDAGVTWRRGELGTPGEGVFNDVVAHAGLVFSR